ncbi:MAG TPA: hypothetical protein VN372_04770 [Methanospirillum sp.]|nr:hypothetical protein [Methanospirillum sp.]
MTSSPEYQTKRTAEYSARDLLRRQGYDVVRVTELHGRIHSPFHLIAWKGNQVLLFIRIRTTRIRGAAESINDEMAGLAHLVRSGRYPGEVQFWIKSDQWRRYRIFPGGAVRISNDTVRAGAITCSSVRSGDGSW